MNLELFLVALVRTSLQAGVLVLIILFAQWVFRRHLPPRWRAALWLLVIVRLLLPIAPSSSFSVFNLVPSRSEAMPVASNVDRIAVAVSQPAIAPNKLLPPAVAPDRRTAPAPVPQEIYEQISRFEPALETRALPKISPAPAQIQQPTPATGLTWLRLALWIWLVGVLSLFAQVAAASIRLSRRCRYLPAIADPKIQSLLDKCARQIGVSRKPQILASSDVLASGGF